MNIHKIYQNMNKNFMGRIIDSHAHIGCHEGTHYTKQDLDVFIKSELPNKDTVEKIIVSDLDVLHSFKGEYQGNKDILELFKNAPQYEILVSCNPKEGNIENIKKLYKKLNGNIVGLKFHPQIQNLELSDPKYKPYFKFAQKHNLPCLFHTQVNLTENGLCSNNINKLSDPEIVYSAAKNYQGIPFVMAHMGAGYNAAHDKAIDVLIESIRKGNANLYADISWVDIDAGNKDHILKAIKRLKGIGEKDWTYGDQSYRLIFGSDAPLGRFKNINEKDSISDYTRFIEDIKSAIRNDKDLKTDAEKVIEDLFYNNAKKLYLDNNLKQKNKSLLVLALCSTGAILSGIGYAIYKTKSENLTKKV